MAEIDFDSLHGMVAQVLERESVPPRCRRLYWLLAMIVAGIVGFAVYDLLRSDAISP